MTGPPRRVVVTGLGVVAPNGVGVPAFEEALRHAQSGVRHVPVLADLGFGCQVGGVPPVTDSHMNTHFSPLERKSLKATGIIYGLMAGTEAWSDAGLPMPDAADAEPDWDSGCVFGAGIAGAEVMRDAAYLIDEHKVKRLGSGAVPQVMASGISAYLGGRLALGNQVTSNASACSTGAESILMGYERVRSGRARRMVCGGCDSGGPYVWGGFDAMRVTTRAGNDCPESASRPMSATAAGFVPGSGAGAMVLEERESARARGARIHAEMLGGAVNAGGQRAGGTMTAPNVRGIVRCIRGAIEASGVGPHDIDVISGHLTATLFDPIEIEQWSVALGRSGSDFPYINSLKSMIGHCLSAAGAIESVASIIQLREGFIHASLNCEDLHPAIASRIDGERIPRAIRHVAPRIAAKSSFGFGDVNSCILFRSHS